MVFINASLFSCFSPFACKMRSPAFRSPLLGSWLSLSAPTTLPVSKTRSPSVSIVTPTVLPTGISFRRSNACADCGTPNRIGMKTAKKGNTDKKIFLIFCCIFSSPNHIFWNNFLLQPYFLRNPKAIYRPKAPETYRRRQYCRYR